MTQAEAERRQRRYARRRRAWRKAHPPAAVDIPIADPGPLVIDPLAAE